MGRITKVLNEISLMLLQRTFLHFYWSYYHGQGCCFIGLLLLGRIGIVRKTGFWVCRQSTWLSYRWLSCQRLFPQWLPDIRIPFSYRKKERGRLSSWLLVRMWIGDSKWWQLLLSQALSSIYNTSAVVSLYFILEFAFDCFPHSNKMTIYYKDSLSFVNN